MQSKSKRDVLLVEAARLLAAVGPDVSTRAICEAAGVTAPTLYHYFGDRAGLLQAVVAHGFSEYLAGKRALESTGDPIEDLRLGWNSHCAWGIEHPAFYALMYGQVRPGEHAAAADEARQLLLEKVDAAAERGLLRMPREVAANMILSANVGLTLHLIRQPDAAADDLVGRLREATLGAILVMDSPPVRATPAAAAITLKAALAASTSTAVDAAELQLLDSWLDRLALS